MTNYEYLQKCSGDFRRKSYQEQWELFVGDTEDCLVKFARWLETERVETADIKCAYAEAIKLLRRCLAVEQNEAFRAIISRGLSPEAVQRALFEKQRGVENAIQMLTIQGGI